MKNGPYILVVAPDDYPGKRYRGRYCYEHHLVWWMHTGELLNEGEIIHHKNRIKTDNAFLNLEKLTKQQHQTAHFSPRPVRHGTLTGYNRCRCAECRRAKTAHTRIYRARKREETGSDR